jgi:uncharacterized delta-60 repeat protein
MKTNLSRLSALLLAGTGIHSAHAAPGDLDLTFNGTGKRTTTTGSGDDIGHSLVIQPDGKILLGGYTNISAPTADFAIVRYTAAGAVDNSFDTDGIATTDFGGYHDNGFSLALQNDGGILLAGQSSMPVTDYDFSLARYLPANGAPDNGFDTDGKATTDFVSGNGNDGAVAVTVQTDGKIVAAGYAAISGYQDIALVRYNLNGSRDTTFHGDGRVTISTSSMAGVPMESANAVAVQSDGRIVVAGYSNNGSNNDVVLLRYTATGDPDNSFNGTGKVILPVGSGHDAARSMVLQPDGKILVAGFTYDGPNRDFLLLRFTTNGQLDLTFNGTGIVVSPIGSGDDIGRSVALQADGKILVGGTSHNGSNYDAALVRYNTDGSPDTSFNGTGKITTPIGSGDDYIVSIAVQPDGRIVGGGYSFNGSNYDFAVLRWQGETSHTATFASASDVPLTFKGFTASGQTISLALNYAPTTGTNLTVVNNTGLGFINGTFSNLAQGQVVPLTYNGVTYNFVANYYGGTGNDLVLVWKDSRLMAWGLNFYGQLGDNTTTDRYVPVAVDRTGVLTGKTVVAVAEGLFHTLALCSDGTLAAWGNNNSGQLGNNSTVSSLLPVAVNTSAGVSALFGKSVVAIAAGSYHSVALCSDGTVAAWGYNNYGQLGDNTTTHRNAPVAVDTATGVSALFGKSVVAIAASWCHSVALCSDGSVAAWGYNSSGQLGDNTTTQRNAPVAVNTAPDVSALFGKTVVAVVAGERQSGALCSDGTVAAWGNNNVGQLGDNTTTQRNVPVAVNTASGVSALSGKTVVAVVAGESHSGALCSDGTVVAWGFNYYGQLGDNTTTQRNAPVAVNTASGVSALFGKSVVAAVAGAYHSGALCSDGTVAAWGNNGTGQLGDNTNTQRNAPVAVSTIPLGVGERFTACMSGSNASHSLALVASPPDTTPPDLNPVIIASNNANPAWAKLGDTVTLSFTSSEPIQTPSVILLGLAATVTNTSGNNWTATATVFPFSMEVPAAFHITAVDMLGNTAPVVTATTDTSIVKVDKGAPGLSLPANMTVSATSAAGAVVGFSATATDNLDPSPGVIVTPSSGSTFDIGTTPVNVTATDAAGNSSNGGFTVTVLNSSNAPVFTTAGTVPLTANGFNATGLTVGAMTLGFDPAPGQVLTLVNNTSANPIGGAFTDLADGGVILTTYGGRSLLFIASYTGGDGNDLILTLLNPEIVIEQPLLTDVADGGSQSFGTVVLGNTASLVFTIKNTGPGILNGLTITKSGTNETEFSVTAAPTAPVSGPAGTTSFTVQFNPATSGAKIAAIHIASDDADENPFDITLTGQALSPGDDTDLDGLNDAAEFLLATLGYDWQVSQPALVNTLLTNANIAGLYTQPQVQALNVDSPLLTRNPATGKFKLTLGIQKSADLIEFDPFPFTAPETSINPQGKLEFEFTSPGNAAFFRLGAE